jgi:hypothetical protein
LVVPVSIVMVTMPCDAKNGPHEAMLDCRAVKPGQITTMAKGGSALVGW